MSYLLPFLPIYLLGNLHCAGMCGPLVALIGQHRYRRAYFLGRFLAFMLAGMVAGELGAVLTFFLQSYHISALLSLIFGGWIILLGLSYLLPNSRRRFNQLPLFLQRLSQHLAHLMGKDTFFSLFLFGGSTILLPCGQSLMVFSASALSASAWMGGINAAVFALLTSPSLWIAMRALSLFKKLASHYRLLMGIFALLVGGLSLCRGLAEFGVIDHLKLNSNSAEEFHLILY